VLLVVVGNELPFDEGAVLHRTIDSPNPKSQPELSQAILLRRNITICAIAKSQTIAPVIFAKPASSIPLVVAHDVGPKTSRRSRYLLPRRIFEQEDAKAPKSF
jgi:hypothetical protein